jgi:hypothetical protein
MDRCPAEFASDVPGRLPLTCDRPGRRHLVHHDPRTGVRYLGSALGVFDLCGLLKHRPGCPIRTR